MIMKTIQKTIVVGDKKIKIKSRPRTACKNFIGYAVHISDNQGHSKKFNSMFLERTKAVDAAYARFVKCFY